MSGIDVIDDSFDKNLSTSYFLSIRVSPDGLSFSVLDPVRNVYILLRSFDYDKPDENFVKTQEHLIMDPVLNYTYKRVYFLFETQDATLVPGALYNEKEAANALKLTSGKDLGAYAVKSRKIKLADAWNVFAIPDYLYFLVKSQFSEISFYQQYSPLIEANLITGKIEPEPVMYLNLRQHSFDVVVLEKYSIRFCNSFKYRNTAEFAYFALNVLKQLNLDQQKVKIHMSGRADCANECLNLTRRYVRNVFINSLPGHFEFGTAFKTVKSEEFYNLFTLPLCE
ncbi:MAG: DUF3822 family protein [Chlorobi bacterium]|nr:DUF3822 family protein [Chlorobiota bacterium]